MFHRDARDFGQKGGLTRFEECCRNLRSCFQRDARFRLGVRIRALARNDRENRGWVRGDGQLLRTSGWLKLSFLLLDGGMPGIGRISIETDAVQAL
jgi:hypothetical protein